MASVSQGVASAQGALKQLQDTLASHEDELRQSGVGVPLIQDRVAQLLELLDQEFDVVARGRELRLSAEQLQQQVWYQKRCRRSLEDGLQDERAARAGGRIQAMWFIRAGLSDPSIPPGTMSRFLQEFPREETAAISTTYIGRVRNCFAELIKDFNRREVAGLVSQDDGERCVVYVPHIHDETVLEVKSRKAPDVELQGELGIHNLARGRNSKIQNTLQ